MKNLIKTAVAVGVIAFSITSNAAPEPMYQITPDDTSVSKLIQRWSDSNELGFEWNVSYDYPIKNDSSDITKLNSTLSQVEKLKDAVNVIIESSKNWVPAGRNKVGSELAMCYFDNEAVIVYTADQPNCGHVEPTPTTVDDE